MHGGVLLSLALALPLQAESDPKPPYPPSGMAPTSQEDLPGLAQTLRTGDWNERIHAVHELGNMGGPALAELTYALEDGDWQVRLTAAHWLGRLGDQAAPGLALALRQDPCRIVRLTAVHWLGSLGPKALALLSEADSDESRTLQGYGRYWRRKLADPESSVPSAGNEENPEDYHEDLNVCANMSRPGRLKKIPEEPKNPPPATPPGPPRDIDPYLELEPAPAAPENLPRPKGLPAHPEKGEIVRTDVEPAPRKASGGSPRGRLEEPESKLPAPQGPVRSEKRIRAYAALLSGERGPLTHDAIPDLIEILKEGDSRLRSRAADELGKMGAPAAPAVRALADALKDESARVRASAALALGNIGPAAEGSIPLLGRALRDPNPDVRYSAAHALARLGTPAAKKAYNRYMREEARRSPPG